MEIGLREHQDWRAVERNIRTVLQIAYNRNPLFMNELAGCTLTEPTCASDFIFAVFVHIGRETEIGVRQLYTAFPYFVLDVILFHF